MDAAESVQDFKVAHLERAVWKALRKFTKPPKADKLRSEAEGALAIQALLIAGGFEPEEYLRATWADTHDAFMALKTANS